MMNNEDIFYVGKLNEKSQIPLFETDIEFRKMFHRSISKYLKIIPQSDKDWTYQIEDVDEPGPLKYLLYYFHNPSEKCDYVGYMVVMRVGTYNIDKKEMLSDKDDKIIVFKFKNVDELIK